MYPSLVVITSISFRVKDGGDPQLEEEVQFTINVTDINDNFPAFINCGTVPVKENMVYN